MQVWLLVVVFWGQLGLSQQFDLHKKEVHVRANDMSSHVMTTIGRALCNCVSKQIVCSSLPCMPHKLCDQNNMWIGCMPYWLHGEIRFGEDVMLNQNS